MPFPSNDLNRALEKGKVYIMFETNEGDTPRIVTSQFTSAWLSPNRGSIPVAWASDNSTIPPPLPIHFGVVILLATRA